LDDRDYYGGYPDQLAVVVKKQGFSMLILRDTGDQTKLGTIALKYFRNYQCAIPVLFVSTDYDSIVLNTQVANITFEDTIDGSFIQGPVYVLFVFIPCAVSSIYLGMLSLHKLWRLGAPYRNNTAVMICYVGLLQSIPSFIFAADTLSMPSRVNWPGIIVCVTIGMECGIFTTYLLALEFHVCVEAIKGTKAYITKKTIPVFFFTSVLSISTIISQSYQALAFPSVIPWSAISVVLYVIFRLFVVLFFAHGQLNIMRVLSDSGQTGTSAEGNKKRIAFMGHRLLSIAVGSIGIIISTLMIASSSVFDRNSGWITFQYAAFFTTVTTLAEVYSLPSFNSRDEELAKLAAELRRAKDSTADISCCLWMTMKKADWRSQSVGGTVVNIPPPTASKEMSKELSRNSLKIEASVH